MVQISFEAEFKSFRFSHESIIKGKEPTVNQSKIQVVHAIGNLDYLTLNETELKVKFHFWLEITPDLGEYIFDGECIMRSPQQVKILYLLNEHPGNLKRVVNKFLLKGCYYYAKKLAQSENLFFPPIQKVLESHGIK